MWTQLSKPIEEVANVSRIDMKTIRFNNCLHYGTEVQCCFPLIFLCLCSKYRQMWGGLQYRGFPSVNRLSVIPRARRQSLHYHPCPWRTSFIINVCVMDYERCLPTPAHFFAVCFVISPIEFNWRVCFPPPPDNKKDLWERMMITRIFHTGMKILTLVIHPHFVKSRSLFHLN